MRKQLVVLFLLLFSNLCFSQIAYQKPLLGTQINWSHPHAKGLVAFWMYNDGSGGVIRDLTPNHYDGAMTNMTAADAWENGRGEKGNAVDLVKASDHYILFGDILNDFGRDGTDRPFSIVGWGFIDDATDFCFLSKVTGNGEDEAVWNFEISDSDQLRWSVYDSRVSNRLSVRTNFTLTDREGDFIMLVGTYNGEGSSFADLKMYIDGELVTNTVDNDGGSYVSMESTDGIDVETGRLQGSSTRDTDGQISDVRVYDYELSAHTIRELYYDPYALMDDPMFRMLTAAAAAALRRRNIIVF